MIAKRIALSSQVDFYPELSCLKAGDCEDIYLSPSEKKLLEIVLEGKGSKENILQQIWLNNGTIVGESSYHQLVKMLRRKLQKANLPGTVIKTLPRYGIIYLRPDEEPLAPVPAPDAELPAQGHEPPAEDVTTDAAMDAASHLNAPAQQVAVLPVSDDIPPTRPLAGSRRWWWLLAPLLLVLPPLLVMLWLPKAENFPAERVVQGVAIHASRNQLLAPDMLQMLLGMPDNTLRHIYIAENGPGIWIARCKSEIVKVNNQCQYQNLSLY
ncbi:winged helix-turn-helix domain-containing protein [Pantoea sp. B65]|uniref:winged helix-turn-helix domain-containing protein n=1 Tax=Pantoea sp. B65 TaxID=2813359 RepID=UPI0039B52C3B